MSRDQETGPGRGGRGKLRGGNRLVDTRLAGTRPGNQQQQLQPQKQRQQQNQVGKGEGYAGRCHEPTERGMQGRRWSGCGQAGHSRHRDQRQTLVHGECTLITPGTVQIHGLGTAGWVLVAREGRQREGTRRGGTRRWLKGGKGTGAGSGSLVLLD